MRIRYSLIGRCAVVLGLALLPDWGSARAQNAAGDPCLIAQIVSISGVEQHNAIVILTPGRPGQRRQREARLRECLRPGEQVRVIAPEPVQVTIRLRGETRRLTARTPPLTIAEQPEPSLWNGFRALVRSFRIFTTTPEAAVVETFARRSLGRVRAHPLLPAGEQLFPRGYDTMTVLWRGPEAPVELDTSSGRIVDSSWNVPGNRNTFARLSLDGNYTLLVADQLRYPITIVDPARIPEPGWMDGRVSVSHAERMARALWILTEGPAAWRLFAVDELRRLQGSSFAAERIWEWVLTIEEPRGGQ